MSNSTLVDYIKISPNSNNPRNHTIDKITIHHVAGNLFISQPMRGKTDEEILATRAKAIESAKHHLGEDVEVIDSFFQNAPAEAKPLWYLGKSLELLATADVAYFAPGWELTRGCKIENLCAIEYGITVIEDYGKTEK